MRTVKYIGAEDGWSEIGATGRQTEWRRGGVDSRSATEAELLLSTGLFEDVIPPTEFMPIFSAHIASTQGQFVHECRQIIDGPDRGARLIWAVPDGATEPTWCWWLWPQSAY